MRGTLELTREPSGPRPSCRVTDIISKPLIWNCGAGVIWAETRTTAIPLTPTSQGAGVIAMPELSVPSTHAARRTSDIDQ